MIPKYVLRIVTDVLKQNLNITTNKTQGAIGQSQFTMSTYEYHFKTTLICFGGHCLILLPLMYPSVIYACFYSHKELHKGTQQLHCSLC